MKATYITHMGDDLMVVNAARVSFNKKSPGLICTDHQIGKYELSAADKSLIGFLARGCTSGEWDEIIAEAMDMGGDLQTFRDERPDLSEMEIQLLGYQSTAEGMAALLNHVRKMPSHFTPFAHPQISLHLKVPLFVARQIMKHQVGFVVNEVSRRYVDEEPEFYEPDVWRGRSADKKQGSFGFVDLNGYDDWTYNQSCLAMYNDLLADGVAPEQARMVLPQSMYTEFWMTGSLYGWANLYVQRTDSHAQKETQEIARQIGSIIAPLYPESWKALTA